MSTLRAYQTSDRGGCLALFDSNVPRFFGAHERAEYEAFLDRLPGPYLVIEDNGRLVACGGVARHRTEPGSFVLCWGMVARGRHRGGFGRILLEERVRRLLIDPAVERIVINTSQHSAGFFAKLGFETTAIEPNGFAKGIDRHEMRLERAAAERSLRSGPPSG